MTAVKSQHCSRQVSQQPNTHENVTWVDILFPLSGNAKVKGKKKLDERSYQVTRMASCITKQSQLFLPFEKKKKVKSLNSLQRKINETHLWKCHRFWSAYAQTSSESNSTLTVSVRVRFPAEEQLSHQFSTCISRARASYSHKLNQHTVI